MSYSYLFYSASQIDGKRPLPDAKNGVPLGSVEQIKAELIGLFPGLVWKQSLSHNDETWFGHGARCGDGVPEFTVPPENDGKVRTFGAAYISRDEVLRIIISLKIVAFDPQSGDILELPDTD